jgi:hypothetical protein
MEYSGTSKRKKSGIKRWHRLTYQGGGYESTGDLTKISATTKTIPLSLYLSLSGVVFAFTLRPAEGRRLYLGGDVNAREREEEM